MAKKKERPRIVWKTMFYAKNGKKKNRTVTKIRMRGVSSSGKRKQVTFNGLCLSYKELKHMFLQHLKRQ